MSRRGIIDVIVTSICRKTLDKTLESFFKNIHFSGSFRFIVNVNVVNENYLKKLNSIFNEYNITDIKFSYPKNKGAVAHAHAIDYLINKVQTPFYFHLEDDWVFRKSVDMDILVALMESEKYIHNIRFNREQIKDSAWLYHKFNEDIPSLRREKTNCTIKGIDLVKTHVWSFNPSIARTAVAKTFLPVPALFPEGPNPEKTFCHRFDEIYEAQGAYIYGRIKDSAFTTDIGRNKYREKWRALKNKLKYKH